MSEMGDVPEGGYRDNAVLARAEKRIKDNPYLNPSPKKLSFRQKVGMATTATLAAIGIGIAGGAEKSLEDREYEQDMKGEHSLQVEKPETPQPTVTAVNTPAENK